MDDADFDITNLIFGNNLFCDNVRAIKVDPFSYVILTQGTNGIIKSVIRCWDDADFDITNLICWNNLFSDVVRAIKVDPTPR